MNMHGKAVLSWKLPAAPDRMTERPMTDACPEENETTANAELAALRIPPDAEEAHWVQRARTGDVAAFDWLMTRYRERAIRLAAHILRRPAEAEDLAQEAFLRAFWQIHNFRGDAAFYTWLYRIVVRLCLNRRRSPWWQREMEPLSDGEDIFNLSATTSREATETRLLIENLLDRLTPPLRAALVLRELEGLDYAEIADALEIPVGTVRSRLNAARQQFRALWQRAQEEARNV